jgi:hypothetical protein
MITLTFLGITYVVPINRLLTINSYWVDAAKRMRKGLTSRGSDVYLETLRRASASLPNRPFTCNGLYMADGVRSVLFLAAISGPNLPIETICYNCALFGAASTVNGNPGPATVLGLADNDIYSMAHALFRALTLAGSGQEVGY